MIDSVYLTFVRNIHSYRKVVVTRDKPERMTVIIKNLVTSDATRGTCANTASADITPG